MVNTLKSMQHFLTQTEMPSTGQEVNRVLWQTLSINLAVAVVKIVVGLVSSSISMVADGFHSAMDATSNVIGLVGSTLAGRPPDGGHPYGHQKYETFATLAIGLLLLLTSWNILKSVFSRFFDGSRPEVTALSFGVMMVTISLNLLVAWYERRKGQELDSSLLLADAEHTRSDIFVSLSVLVSLATVKLGWLWMDAVVALVIVLVIARTGWGIVRRASDVLADRAVVDTARVEKIVLAVKGVQSCHKIRSRGSKQAAHLDLHIQVDGQMPLVEAHDLGHVVQRRLQQILKVEDIIVHVEPARPVQTLPYS